MRQEYFVGLAIGIAIGATVVWMLRRNSQTMVQNPIQYPQIALPPGNYHNAETWDITWNKDGTLPERVTVSRDATRS